MSREEAKQLASALHVLECYNEHCREPITRFKGPEVHVYVIRDVNWKRRFQQLLENEFEIQKGETINRI